MIRTLLEIRDSSEVPNDEDPKQAFSMGGDFWMEGHYSQAGGEWIDANGHAIVNVICWCELPHPANLTEVITKTVYEVGRSEITIAEVSTAGEAFTA
jgi:hypothetical protein